VAFACWIRNKEKTTYMLNDIVGHGKFIIIIWDELGVPVVLIGT